MDHLVQVILLTHELIILSPRDVRLLHVTNDGVQYEEPSFLLVQILEEIESTDGHVVRAFIHLFLAHVGELLLEILLGSILFVSLLSFVLAGGLLAEGLHALILLQI